MYMDTSAEPPICVSIPQVPCTCTCTPCSAPRRCISAISGHQHASKSPDPMAKFPGQLGQPPLSIPRLVAVKTSTLPTLHRNVTTPQTSRLSAQLPTVYEYSTYPFALPLCLAWPHLALPIPCSATPSASPPANGFPLGWPPWNGSVARTQKPSFYQG